jgi:hypothetical protein
LVAFGVELRPVHSGKINYHKQKVYINDAQYFDNVPPVAWNFTLAGINLLRNG